MKPGWALQWNIFTDPSGAVPLLWVSRVVSVLFLFCFHLRLFVDALWWPSGRGLAS